MPTSPWNSITPIMNVVMELYPVPASALDIGIGFGKYGFLCREYLTYWNSPQQPRQIVIDGIEAYAEYVGELQKQIYNRIHIGDAASILPQFAESSYDLALMVDVLEHFDMETGKAIIREICRVSKVAIVSTPRQFWEQGDSWGNPFERHKSLWTKEDLLRTGALKVLRSENWIAVYAKAPYRERFTYRYLAYKTYQKIKRAIFNEHAK